jgi:hypothetical protein
MFCDGCGAQLQANQRHCSGCGKMVTGSIEGYPKRNRIQEHVRLLAILWFALSAFEAIGGVVLLVLANTLFLHLNEITQAPAPAGGFLHLLFTVLGIFVLAKSVAGFFTGWGLLNREPWARIMALVLGFLALIHPPFGTALGVYTLWVLLPSESEAEYARYQNATAA